MASEVQQINERERCTLVSTQSACQAFHEPALMNG